MEHHRTIKTGLFFGSFDPIHAGHLIIAQYFAEFSDLDNIWFVLSPQNPFKKNHQLLPERQRLDLIERAIANNPHFSSCDIELTLGTPSYTINTLRKLQEVFPDQTFVLIVGSDNMQSLGRWKDSEEIMNGYDIYVYPRPGHDIHSMPKHSRIRIFEAPMLEISSSAIRQMIEANKKPLYLVPEQVLQKIESEGYYK